jgi:nitrile hydratase accessory protein
MTPDRAPDLPALPRDEAGAPVFQAPWEAQAFAMAVRLHEAGHFTWTEWAERLAQAIKRAQAAGDPDRGDTYYHHWLVALESLVAEKGLIAAEELRRRKAEWEAAALATPHGKHIELHRGRGGGS